MPVFSGRLIYPSVVVLRQLDTDATRTAGAYDDEFREPKLVDGDADGIGESQLVEQAELKLSAQVATRRFEFAEQSFHGQVPESDDLELTFHMRDLTAKGLVAADGRAKLVPGDRLDRIEDRTGAVMHTFPNPPGMFLVAARPSGFLQGVRNLLVCTFSARDQDAILRRRERTRQN